MTTNIPSHADEWAGLHWREMHTRSCAFFGNYVVLLLHDAKARVAALPFELLPTVAYGQRLEGFFRYSTNAGEMRRHHEDCVRINFEQAWLCFLFAHTNTPEALADLFASHGAEPAVYFEGVWRLGRHKALGYLVDTANARTAQPSRSGVGTPKNSRVGSKYR